MNNKILTLFYLGWASVVLGMGILCFNKTKQYEGTVRLDGKPLAGATVRFVLADSEGSEWCHACTDEFGAFIIDTGSVKSKLAPGKYKVTVAGTPNIPDKYLSAAETPFEVVVLNPSFRFEFDINGQ